MGGWPIYRKPLRGVDPDQFGSSGRFSGYFVICHGLLLTDRAKHFETPGSIFYARVSCFFTAPFGFGREKPH